jgi:Protein of unknown function (DUF2934)
MANQHDSGRHETEMATRDDVAKRAYELFQARGGEPGHELENWLEAERELGRSSSDVKEQSRGPRRDGDR